ncbi:hypothetical protein KXD40_004290 [Peronospora effusa]|uniref:RING-type domain-containing protein n=1 Tax=Peronospora effusa TaxID=542832 RepID=A0A3M6VGM1_9STRA|nr:hypothetical protein DD238_004132 [Peronospora effusa]UIZ28282.1 hypothetical protein KXD40_004290 [Peronospora effusa]CAI5701120.1 unnamed protein product [Peronospora effusa]
MSTISNTSGSTESTQQQTPVQRNFVFVLPPPPTIWVQFNNGMQLGFTPSPGQHLQSVLHGVPFFGGETNGNNSNGLLNALNELFQRAQEQQHGPPPTSKLFLDKLPMKMWTQDMQKTESQTDCVICLSEFEKDDKVISLPCGHTFHKDCGMTWLIEHNVCPTCRYQLPTQTEPTTAQAATQTSPGATSEPEQELQLQGAAVNVTGVRRQRPTETNHPRDVRQRVNEPSLTSVDEDVDMDLMLEEEAERFVKEEMEQRRSVSNDDSVEIQDRDVEEFLYERSSLSHQDSV